MDRDLPYHPAVAEIALMTLVSVVASMGLTAAAMEFFFGRDFSAVITVGNVWALGIGTSFFAPLVICPLVAAPTARLIRQLRRTRAELERAANQDALTGVLNRRGFDASATACLDLCRDEGTPVVALMCDVDFFKSINDRYGHDFGDGALEQIAATIGAALASREAVIGRLGGEEFAILLPNCQLPEGEKLADAIRLACQARSVDFGGLTHQVTVSLGVAETASDIEDLSSLLSRADAALYQAKRDGRNRVVIAPNRGRYSRAA